LAGLKTITEEQLKRIQSLCREWLSDPATNSDSRLTIPAGAVLPQSITIEIKSILTFDNVRITSAVDTETGACYTKLIGKSGDPGTFIDATIEMIAGDGVSTGSDSDRVGPSTARTAQNIDDRQEPGLHPDAIAPGTDAAVAIKPYDDLSMAFDSDLETPKYFLCSHGTVLGFSALEKTKPEHRRTGRFFPSDDYYEFAEIFQQFPTAENDCLEANVREAYGLKDDDADDLRRKFNELCGRIDALKLYVADESGKQIATTELRLEDLSYFYSDESERWLHVRFEN
jgi:hypothetical protein